MSDSTARSPLEVSEMTSRAWPPRGWWVALLVVALFGSLVSGESSWSTLWQLPAAGAGAAAAVRLFAWGIARLLPKLGGRGVPDSRGPQDPELPGGEVVS